MGTFSLGKKCMKSLNNNWSPVTGFWKLKEASSSSPRVFSQGSWTQGILMVCQGERDGLNVDYVSDCPTSAYLVHVRYVLYSS